MAVLEQLSKEIVETELRLRQYRIRWRKITSRLTYLFLALEISYVIYWYFFTPSGAPPIDAMIHLIVVASIPLLYVPIYQLIHISRFFQRIYYLHRIKNPVMLDTLPITPCPHHHHS